MIQISAGSAVPILVSTLDVDITIFLVRETDAKYWSGTAWVVTETLLPTLPFISGVRKYVTPKLSLGHYWLQFSNGYSEQVYAGGYLYNSEVQTCVVHGTVKDMTGEPVQNSRAYFEPAPIIQFIDGNAITMQARTAYTDVNGEFAIEVVRTVDVIIIIEDIGYRKRVFIPDKTSVDIKDL